MRVHSGSLLWLCIRLHDTNTKCHAGASHTGASHTGASHTGASHTGASHTGASSPRFLCRSEIFIPAKIYTGVIAIKVSSILRHYKTRTPINTALCKHGATFYLARNESRAVIMQTPPKGRFTRYDFAAYDKLTTGLRHELLRVNQTYNSLNGPKSCRRPVVSLSYATTGSPSSS